MAANIALPYAAGIPAPACQQRRRSMVIKAQKTSIMANPPAVQHCEQASGFGSIPRHPLTQPSFSTKRNNTMVVGAYPDLKLEITPGIPVYTDGRLENFSGELLKLDDKIFWEGPRPEYLDKEIEDGNTGCFLQKADSGGSIGGLEYVFPGDEYKWVIAWSNARNDLNKVYTVIHRDDVDWNEIKQSLDASGQESIFNGLNHDIPYSSVALIDKTSPTPTIVAVLLKAGVPLASTKSTLTAANISKDLTQADGQISKDLIQANGAGVAPATQEAEKQVAPAS
ncbi:hypothetical protein ES332_A05G314700v1 [Gossypium tomentosum]|uniref:Uncharacterized protein n=1 Tax=Gossypium tomentosum TaxID=34277 RepID=A0A5D2QMF4_GOSTO|nr:hypothetical protein ES332_A05G314700v1 [Gossypium tomentosum]